jgi:hypothetical protein
LNLQSRSRRHGDCHWQTPDCASAFPELKEGRPAPALALALAPGPGPRPGALPHWQWHRDSDSLSPSRTPAHTHWHCGRLAFKLARGTGGSACPPGRAHAATGTPEGCQPPASRLGPRRAWSSRGLPAGRRRAQAATVTVTVTASVLSRQGQQRPGPQGQGMCQYTAGLAEHAAAGL